MPFHYSDAMLERIATDPGLPVDNPTTAVWQDPPHILARHRSPLLSEHADIVVIGSGITACSFVRNLFMLLEDGKKPTVVVLEARTLCSGATGRNGGHLRDTPSLYFSDLVERFGIEAAVKMLRFRSSQVSELLQVVREEALSDIEFRAVEAVDLICEEEKWTSTMEELEEFDRLAPIDITRPKIWEREAARTQFGVKTARGAITYPAGTHSSYKLVTGLWQKLHERLGQFLHLETTTSALDIKVDPGEGSPYSFQVETPRGTIRTQAVVHCSNSHVAHLVPGMRGKVFPVREQMTEQHFAMAPVDSARSAAFLWRKGFDYFIHRPDTPERQGALLVGGALSQSGDDGFDEFGVPSDADRGLFIAAYLRGLLPTMYDPRRETKLISSWTGIMGWSADLMPWVGFIPVSVTQRVPRRQLPDTRPFIMAGEWICAGYSGEGMTHAWGCGKALAMMVLGEPSRKLTDWFPAQYLITEERVKVADVRKLRELY